MEAIHVFHHCASFMKFKLIEEAAYTLVRTLHFSSSVRLGVQAASLIDTTPFVISSHLDKMYCMVAVQVWACWV